MRIGQLADVPHRAAIDVALAFVHAIDTALVICAGIALVSAWLGAGFLTPRREPTAVEESPMPEVAVEPG